MPRHNVHRAVALKNSMRLGHPLTCPSGIIGGRLDIAGDHVRFRPIVMRVETAFADPEWRVTNQKIDGLVTQDLLSAKNTIAAIKKIMSIHDHWSSWKNPFAQHYTLCADSLSENARFSIIARRTPARRSILLNPIYTRNDAKQ